MVNTHDGREKLFHYQINRQSRPLIDQHLQIQLPEACSYPELPAHQGFHALFSYYSPSFSSTNNFPLSQKEVELKLAMTEAEKSYQAWNRMKQQVLEATQKYFSKLSSKT